MRGRALGLGLLGLGAFALVAALLVRVLLVPGVVKLPLDQVSHPVADGTDVEWFSAHEGKQFEGATAVVKEDVVGQAGSPDASGDVAVWDVKSVMTDTSSGAVINKSAYTVCLDRRTAQAVRDCASARSDHGAITGLTLNFPFHTQRSTYQFYDSTVGKAFPARFRAVEHLKGLTVYRFEQDVPETVVETQNVPGDWAGAPGQAGVDADFVYSTTRTIWVEPTSGMIVKLQEQPNTVVRGPDGTIGVTWLKGTFTVTDDGVTQSAKDAAANRKNIVVISAVLPWTLVGIGVVALLVGALLVSRAGGRGRPGGLDEPTAPTRVPQVQ